MHGHGWLPGGPGMARFWIAGPGPGMVMALRRGACGRHGPPGFHRWFMTRQERIEQLEAYLHELRQEARAVEELLEELKKAGPPSPGGAAGGV